jgi:phosphatidylglycerol---prolipoprotein diacylglyceryl transferase
MHPILFRLPLPGWTLPLFPTLLALAGVGVVLGLLGWRKKLGDLLLIGGALAIGCGFAAFGFKGKTYTLSELPIYSYGAMLCLSLVVGWFLTLGLAERDGLPRETMANCYFITALGALAAARLLYVATNADEFEQLSDLLNIRRGGMVAYGGFLGGFLTSWLYLRSQKLRLLPWADVAVPSLATGLLFTRIGCYLFGCDFGKPLSETAPGWLKKIGTFPRWAEGTLPEGSGSPAWIQHINDRGLPPDATASLPVHPTQLYESLVGLGLLGLVFLIRRRQRFRGEVFFAFTFAYGVLRFLLEILRDDAERGEIGPYLSEHVFMLVALLALAAAYGYGPARSIADVKLRRITQALAVVPAIGVFIWLKPPSFGTATPIQLSTSQWIGLFTAMAVAFAWNVYARGAELSPEAAMSLGLEEREIEKQNEPESDDAEAESDDAKAKRRARRAERKAKAAELEAAGEAAPADPKAESGDADSRADATPAPPKKKQRKRELTVGDSPHGKRKQAVAEPEAPELPAKEKDAEEPAT